MIEKLQRLIRYHRQRVFDDNGELHTRAIERLKRSATFKRMAQENRDRAERARERMYTGMGY